MPAPPNFSPPWVAVPERAAAAAAALSLAAMVALAACGRAQEPPLPGDRVSVLTLEDRVRPDPGIAGLEVRLPAPYVNEDWPQAGGHPSHAMHHLALRESVGLIWQTSIGAGANRDRRLTAAPVVAAGTIYTMDAVTVVSAFRASDGARQWRTSVAPDFEERGAIGGGLAYDGGVLYVATPFGQLHALNPSDASVRWVQDIGIPLRGAPTLAGGRVYVLSHDNRLHAVDAASGEQLWSHVGIQEVAGFVGAASPAVAGDLVVAPYSSGEVFALRGENGRVTWSDSLVRVGRIAPLGELSDIAGLPVIDRGIAFVVGHAGTMVAIDTRSGERIWEQKLASVQSLWVAGEFVFAVTVNAEVVALSRADGRVRWVQQLARFEDETRRRDPIQWTGPVLAGDRLLLGSNIGEVVAVSPYNGRILGSLRLSGGVTLPPIVSNGVLYLLTDSAILLAYR